MYILHYQTNVKDISGQTCIGLVNPVGSGKSLKVSKIEISSVHQIDVALISGEFEASVDVSENIRNSKIGDSARPQAKAYYDPTFLNPTFLIKSASIAGGTQRKLIDPSDFLSLDEGEAIGLRAMPSAQFQTINITFVFDEQ